MQADNLHRRSSCNSENIPKHHSAAMIFTVMTVKCAFSVSAILIDDMLQMTFPLIAVVIVESRWKCTHVQQLPVSVVYSLKLFATTGLLLPDPQIAQTIGFKSLI